MDLAGATTIVSRPLSAAAISSVQVLQSALRDRNSSTTTVTTTLNACPAVATSNIILATIS